MTGERIPTDLMQAAEQALDNMLCNCKESCGSHEAVRAESINDIARALLAERERCARIAEEVDLKPAAGWSEQEAGWWETGQNDAALAIASHIRA